MASRESIEKLLAELRRDQDEAEAIGERARETLSRSTLPTLSELNPDEVEGAADDLAAAVRKIKLLEEVRARLRGLIT